MQTRRFSGWLVFLILAGSIFMSTPGDPSPNLRLRPPVAGCPVCDLWLEYEDVILRAKQEVGPLRDGILYFYHSDEPSVIEPMIRFAHEREDLAEAIRADPDLINSLGGPCGHGPNAHADIQLQISTSARGIFALVTSSDPTTNTRLRFQAGRAVRSKIPVWF
jgi:hypothetical protein